MRINKKILITAIIVILIVIFFLKFLLIRRLAFIDLTPFPDNPRSSLYDFIFLWNDDSFGYLNPETLYRLVAAILGFVLIKPLIAQDFYIISIFLLGYFGFFITLKKIGVRNDIGIIFSFFYLFNPVTISDIHNGGIVQLLVYFLIPWIYITFINLLYKENGIYLISFALLVTLSTVNIQFSFWVSIWLSFFLVIWHINYGIKLEKFLKVIASFVIILLLCINSLFLVFLVSENNAVLDQLSIKKHTYAEASIPNIIRLAGNNGSIQPKLGYMENSIINSLAFLFIIIIVYFMMGFRKNQDSPYKKTYVYFSIIILLFIPLIITFIKQGYVDYLISKGNIFIVSLRNPQKLLYIFSFAYILLFSAAFNNFTKDIKKTYRILTTIAIITIFILFNNFLLDSSFSFNKLKGNNTYYITDKDIQISSFIKNLNDSRRVLYLPWDYSIQKRMSWEKKIIKIKLGYSARIGKSNEDFLAGLYKDICNNKIDLDNLQSLNIKYIVLDKNPISYLNFEKVEEIYQTESCKVAYRYGTPYIWGNYSFFNQLFSNYSVIYEDENFKIIELPINLKAHIFSDNLFFQKINPTKYKIYISNLKDPQNLSFLESYHKGWHLYLKKNPTNKWCEIIEFYNNTNTTECKHKQKFFEGEELSYLLEKPIFDNTHAIVYDYANQWTIDPQYIRDNYSKEYYKENPDGSIDIELVIYFKPQSYFYIGLFISATTFFVCIVYLIYYFLKKR